VPGKHNVIPIKSPQGFLKVELPGHSEYKNQVLVLLKDPKTKRILTHFQVEVEIKVLAGNYEAEILTLPKKIVKISIPPRSHEVITLKQPGVVNFISTSRGIGSLYEMREDGSQCWIHNLNPNLLRNIEAIQPGTYKVVFRSEQALGSKFTKFREFEVKSGSSLKIQL
jgi:Ca-activated chloride channel family protein